MLKNKPWQLAVLCLAVILWGIWSLDVRPGYLNAYTFSYISESISQYGLFTTLFNLFYKPFFFFCLLIGAIAYYGNKKWGQLLLQISLGIHLILQIYGILSAWSTIMAIADVKNVSPWSMLRWGVFILIVDAVLLAVISLRSKQNLQDF